MNSMSLKTSPSHNKIDGIVEAAIAWQEQTFFGSGNLGNLESRSRSFPSTCDSQEKDFDFDHLKVKAYF